MKKIFSSDTIKPRCLGKKNIFPYTRWSQISRIGESLCLLKIYSVIEKISSKYIIKTEWETFNFFIFEQAPDLGKWPYNVWQY